MTQKDLLESFLAEWRNKNGITARTSGSTGLPKEIFLPKTQLLRSAARTNNFFNITPKSRLHCAVSFKFIGGKMMIVRSLLSGCRLTYSEPSLYPDCPVNGQEVDLMSVVPAQFPFILENPEAFSHVKNFLIGGSAIDNRLWNKISSSGFSAWESYGMTETASHIALRPIKDSYKDKPLFVPFEGIRVNADNNRCLIITDNDIAVKTNDIADITSTGFNILGRKDDVIITGGIKVMPQEVEMIIRPYIEKLCQGFYVTGVPDEKWTRLLVLAVVPKGEIDSELERDKIKQQLDSIPPTILPKKLRPKDIKFIERLPLTESGKIIRTLKSFGAGAR